MEQANFPLQNEGKKVNFTNRQNMLVPKVTTVLTTITKLNHDRDVFSNVYTDVLEFSNGKTILHIFYIHVYLLFIFTAENKAEDDFKIVLL
jgi:hypothetical protein